MQYWCDSQKWSEYEVWIKWFGTCETVRRRKVDLGHFLYVPQSAKNLLSASRIVDEGGTMTAKKYKTKIFNSGVSVNLKAYIMVVVFH